MSISRQYFVQCSTMEPGVKSGKMTPHIIKKYGNRRLYDTVSSRYVNLSEIAGMIRKGKDVRVVDAETGEDLTRSVLTQIISEDAKGGPAGLPLELLRQLIIASDHAGRDFLMWYLKSAFDAYGKLQQSFTTGLSDLQTAATSPVQAIRDLLKTSPPRQSADAELELEQLRARLAKLESRSKRRSPKASKKKSSKKRQ